MATISASIILRAGTAMIVGPITHIPESPFGNRVIALGGVTISVLDIFIIVSAVMLVSLFYLFFKRTKWGVAMQATAEDPMAAQLMGIPIKKVYRNVWIFSALVATVGGILLAPRTLLDTNMGYLGLKAFPQLFWEDLAPSLGLSSAVLYWVSSKRSVSEPFLTTLPGSKR